MTNLETISFIESLDSLDNQEFNTVILKERVTKKWNQPKGEILKEERRESYLKVNGREIY